MFHVLNYDKINQNRVPAMNTRYVSQSIGDVPTILFWGSQTWFIDDLSNTLHGKGYESFLLNKEILQENKEYILREIQQRYIARLMLVVDGEEDRSAWESIFDVLKKSHVLKLRIQVDLIILRKFKNLLDKKEKIGFYNKLLLALGGESHVYVLDFPPGTDIRHIYAQGESLSEQISTEMFKNGNAVVHLRVKKEIENNYKKHITINTQDKQYIVSPSNHQDVFHSHTQIEDFDNREDRRHEEMEKRVLSLFSEQIAVDKQEKIAQEKHMHSVKEKNTTKNVRKIFSAKWMRVCLRGALLVLFLLFLISIFTGIQVIQLKNSYASIQKSWENKDISTVKKSLKTFKQSNTILRSEYTFFSPIIKIFIGEDNHQDIQTIFTVNTDATDALMSVLDMSQSLSLAYMKIMSSTSGGLELLDESKWKIEDAYKKLSVFLSQSQNAENITLFSYGNTLSTIRDQINDAQKHLVGIQQLSQILPELLGSEKKMTYLVLVQNAEELRSTGGFLQTIAFFTFEKGQLLDYQIYDVFSTDAQLKGQVDPPEDLKRTLGEMRWYLRDANWDGDFSQVAQQAQWFAEKELGKHIDGVLAVNTHVFPDILSAVGEIEVSEYTETVDEKNVLERISSHTSVGVLGKENDGDRDFLTVLTKNLFTSIVEAQVEQIEPLGVVLFSNVKKGEILVSSDSEEIQRIFSSLGWGGTILSPPCPQQLKQEYCFVDRVYAVDSNVGVNKINPYIKKEVVHDVLVYKTGASHTYTATYKNTSLSQTWPLGTYKNYVRLYLPLGSQVNTVLIDTVPVEQSKLFMSRDGSHEKVGVYMEVPPGKTVQISFSYTTPFSTPSINGDLSYALFTQKQPGVIQAPQKITISLQGKGVFEKIAPKAAIEGKKAVFMDPLETSYYLGVQARGL